MLVAVPTFLMRFPSSSSVGGEFRSCQRRRALIRALQPFGVLSRRRECRFGRSRASANAAARLTDVGRRVEEGFLTKESGDGRRRR